MTTQNSDNIHPLAIKMHSGTRGTKTKASALSLHGRKEKQSRNKFQLLANPFCVIALLFASNAFSFTLCGTGNDPRVLHMLGKCSFIQLWKTGNGVRWGVGGNTIGK